MSKVLDNIGSILYSVGMNANERRVYQACLQKSGCTVAEIAKETGVKRTTLYVICEAMEGKGYLTSLQHQRGKKYHAVKPVELVHKLEREATRLTDRADALRRNLEAFATLENPQAVVQQAEGVEAIGELCLSLVEEPTSEIVAMADTVILDGIISQYIAPYVVKRIENHIPTRCLYSGDWDYQKSYETNMEQLRDFKVAPDTLKLPAYLAITDTMVLIVDVGPKPSAIRIESPIIAATMKNMFEFMWNSLAEYSPTPVNRVDKERSMR